MDPIEDIKQRIDIVQLISEYTPLKKAGRNFKALCPFHTETAPSFMISPERQIFKCFGCGRGGDIFKFIQEKEGLEFGEALEELARRAGVKLVKKTLSPQAKYKERLHLVSHDASRLYNFILKKHKLGERGRLYLSKRGIGKKAIEDFNLGFAPTTWDALLKFLTKKGYSEKEISDTGLSITSREGKFLDRFRDRIMFPIRDLRGRVVGFSARAIELGTKGEEKNEPKYLNGPETFIFQKGNLLFGLDLAAEEIKKKNYTILVEGEMDVIASYQVGIKNIVASKGTSLTSAQVGLLNRFSPNLAICFDEDIAGDAAAKRGIELADQAGMNIKIVQLKSGKDPDEVIKKNVLLWKKAIRNAKNVYDYFLDWVFSNFDSKTSSGKRKIGQEIIPVFAKISDPILLSHYAGQLAKKLQVSENFVFEAIDKEQKKGRVPKIQAQPKPEEKILGITSKSRKERLEEYFLALILAIGDFPKESFSLLSEDDFSPSVFKKIFRECKIGWKKRHKLKTVIKRLPEELKGGIDGLYLTEVPPVLFEGDRLSSEARRASIEIKRESLKEKLAEISAQLKDEEDDDGKELKVFERKLQKISKELQALPKE